MFTHKMIEPARQTDDKGNYLSFRGATVISPVSREDIALWNQFYDFLNNNSKLKTAFSLLPPASYHMTLFGVYDEDDNKDDWQKFVNERLVLTQKINTRMEAAKITPVVAIHQVDLDSTLTLALTLDKAQEELIRALGLELGLEAKIPRRGFHLTLAYKYQDGMDKSVADEIKNEVDGKIRELFKEIRFDLAHLFYFNNMTGFALWNGEGNPWINLRNNFFL